MRIGIDGYNLAIPNGTGVATYGASLARVVADMGHGVEAIFGIDVGRDRALRETLFFEQFGHGHKGDVGKKPSISSRWQTSSSVPRPTLRMSSSPSYS